MGKKVPVQVVGVKSQGKFRGSPLYQVNNHSPMRQRGLTESEIEKFLKGIQSVIARRGLG